MTVTDDSSVDAARLPVLLPLLVTTGALSIASSLFVSNYWGMGIAMTTLVLAACLLKGASARARAWVIGLATAGFALGLMAMLMKIVVMNTQG